jgi:hypothetical protein
MQTTNPMSDLKLGQIITTPQNKDAVHVAVAPVKAGELLIPGTRVSLANGVAVQDFEDKAVGIVDPFLQRSVQVGESFWLFMFPGTTTGLRHEWFHPAFLPTIPNDDEFDDADDECATCQS